MDVSWADLIGDPIAERSDSIVEHLNTFYAEELRAFVIPKDKLEPNDPVSAVYCTGEGFLLSVGLEEVQRWVPFHNRVFDEAALFNEFADAVRAAQHDRDFDSLQEELRKNNVSLDQKRRHSSPSQKTGGPMRVVPLPPEDFLPLNLDGTSGPQEDHYKYLSEGEGSGSDALSQTRIEEMRKYMPRVPARTAKARKIFSKMARNREASRRRVQFLVAHTSDIARQRERLIQCKEDVKTDEITIKVRAVRLPRVVDARLSRIQCVCVYVCARVLIQMMCKIASDSFSLKTKGVFRRIFRLDGSEILSDEELRTVSKFAPLYFGPKSIPEQFFVQVKARLKTIPEQPRQKFDFASLSSESAESGERSGTETPENEDDDDEQRPKVQSKSNGRRRSRRNLKGRWGRRSSRDSPVLDNEDDDADADSDETPLI